VRHSAACCLLLLSVSLGVCAQVPDAQARYERLAHELRCLVCQNQSLAESGAELADDLKREVKSLIAQGKSDAEIKGFLQARYGDFILYKPPMQSNTAVLWIGPFLALGIGVVSAALLLRKRRASAATADHGDSSALSEAQQRELDDRLK
jgi:cytochrome c-type biogenesis protein CcmH